MSVDHLVRTHLGLVDRIAYPYRRHSLHDELVAAGRMGLFVAARTFDARRGVPFESFARRRIRGAMTDQLRSFGHLPKRVYRRAVDAGDPIRHVPMSIDDASHIADARPSPEMSFAHAESLSIVRTCIENLPPSERAMVRTVYFEGRTGKEAAARLGLEKSWGSRLLARGLRQLTKLASRVPPRDLGWWHDARGARAGARLASKLSRGTRSWTAGED